MNLKRGQSEEKCTVKKYGTHQSDSLGLASAVEGGAAGIAEGIGRTGHFTVRVVGERTGVPERRSER